MILRGGNKANNRITTLGLRSTGFSVGICLDESPGMLFYEETEESRRAGWWWLFFPTITSFRSGIIICMCTKLCKVSEDLREQGVCDSTRMKKATKNRSRWPENMIEMLLKNSSMGIGKLKCIWDWIWCGTYRVVKSFSQYVNSKREPRESLGLLLSGDRTW